MFLSDGEINNEELKILSPQLNEVSIQESIQEYLQEDVPILIVRHAYHDPCLFDEDLSQEKILKFHNIEFLSAQMLEEDYYLFLSLKAPSNLRMNFLHPGGNDVGQQEVDFMEQRDWRKP